jgi:hypothetical protein
MQRHSQWNKRDVLFWSVMGVVLVFLSFLTYMRSW